MRKTALLLLTIVCNFAFGQKTKTFDAKLSNGEMAKFELIEGKTDEVALIKTKNNGKSRIVIPSTINNKGKAYKVTVLGSSSLKDCDKNLRELIIPGTVNEIQSSLFINSSTASQVGTAILKYYTFGLAGKRRRASELDGVVLTNLQIGKGVKTIGENAFITFCNIYNKTANHRSMLANISELPDYITASNASYYGLDESYVSAYRSGKKMEIVKDNPKEEIHNVIGDKDNKVGSNAITGSDIDQNVPQNPTTNKKTFAIIIANEVYQRESKVDFALNDGRLFKTYCHQVLGLPEKNIHYLENATLNNMIFELDWIKQVCEAYKGTASIIIYYAGHGIPDEASGKAYLLPADGFGQNTRTCYALNDFYNTIGELQASQVTVFLDACFSGAKRDGKMQMAARGVAIKAKNATVPRGKIVIFSAATGEQTAYSYKEKEHGLFTYFLLKKLKETNGNITLGELSDYVNDEVSQFSIIENGKSQTPTISNSVDIQDIWRSKKLK